MVVVDFPQATACCELILDTHLVNRGPQVTPLMLVLSVLGHAEVTLEFDGRVPHCDQMHLVGGVYQAADYIAHALQPLLQQTSFDLNVIGAEIDDSSETLWVWLDDPTNTLQDHY